MQKVTEDMNYLRNFLHKPPFLKLLGFPQFFYEVFKNIIIAHKLKAIFRVRHLE